MIPGETSKKICHGAFTNGSFTVQLAKQRTNIVGTQIQSTHCNTVLYNLYIITIQ